MFFSRFSSLFVLVVLLAFVSSETTNERNALLDIKAATNHNNWVSSTRNGELSYDTTWNTANAVCGSGSQNSGAWFGVICVNDHIEVLLLATNNVVGTLPATINRLTWMKQLYLFDNGISGSIPTGFNSLTALTHFYVWDNDMTSVLNIQGLTQLQKFYFERNNVADNSINWISTLPRLIEVDGSDNSITATIPSNIQSASLLRKINFNNNQLSGSIPTQLLTHPQMIFVYLNDNNLVGGIPTAVDILGSGLKLQNLDFGNNDLRCTIPDWILQVSFPVDLRNNRFYCPVPASTFNMKTTPETCVQATQTGASLTEHEILGGTAPITLYGTNLDLCTSTGFQCKFRDQFGSGFVLAPATSTTSGSVTCNIPTFTTGGGRFVCIAQGGVEITTNCSYLFTYFDCSTKCLNGGFCDRLTGNCICSVGWKGDTCAERDCGDCNEARGGGYCDSATGNCVCNSGWIGPRCMQGNKVCNYTCEPNGFCSEFTGLCVCSLGWQGDDCTEVFCPPCDTRGGYCANGTCHCYEYWSGVLCNVAGRPCPSGSDCGASLSPPRGRCDAVNGVCQCYPGWEGEICDKRKCPNNCTYPNGVCDTATGLCSCTGFYQLPTCVVQRIPCPNDCSGNGVCNYQTGICSCRYPHIGAEDCSVAVCNPPNCAGHGTCNNQTGQCICDYPWTGLACTTPNATCPNDCSGRGSCNKQTGVCVCPTGYDVVNYPDCSVRSCPGDGLCSGNGNCNTDLGVCECDENYLGNICQTPDFDCPDACNDRGFCQRRTGVCSCYVGYEGESCFARTCPSNCTYPNGECNIVTGRCECADGYDGDACALVLCETNCLNGGECDTNQGVCDCVAGYRGENCALLSCPNDCSGHGTCVGGVCFCVDRYYTENCSIQEPDYPLIVLVIILAVIGGLVLIGVIFMIWRQVMIANLTAQVAGAGGAGVDMDAISDSS